MAKLETVVKELAKTAARFSLTIAEDLAEVFAEEVLEMDEGVFKRRMALWRKSTLYPRLPTFAELQSLHLEPLPMKRLSESRLTPEQEEIRKQRVREAIAKCRPKCLDEK